MGIRIFAFFLLVFFTSATYANQYNQCSNCKIYYTTKRVVKKTTIVQPVAVPVVPQQVPVAPVPQAPPMPYVYGGQGIVSGNIIYMPVQPVVPMPPPMMPPPPPPRESCAWYVDPYDLFGQLFGDPDLVRSCVYY
jgi:hypothetical protein